MFESQENKNTDVTLCIFPNLADFVAVDARSDLPGRPLIRTLSISEISGEDFARGLENDLQQLIREQIPAFLGLMGLPKKVEELVRAHALKSVAELINREAPWQSTADIGSIGVLFFTGRLLHLEAGHFRQLAGELFEGRLSDTQLDDLIEMLEKLIERQRAAENQTSRPDVEQMISGRGGQYVTLWESGKD